MLPNSFAVVGAATLDARRQLTVAAESPARDERRMSQIGEAALFEEALLGALRAHLGELKAVAR